MTEGREEPRRGGRSKQSTQSRHFAQRAGERSGQGSGEWPGEGPGSGDLSKVMGQVARALSEQHGDVEATLQAITAAAIGAIPGAEECSISYVIDRRSVQPRAFTGDIPRDLDLEQERLQEGPCLDAVWQQETVRIDDMRTEERWPRYAAIAVERGVLSALSFQLFVAENNLGALNLYAAAPGVFGEESEDVGLVFAAHAAVALAGARHEQHLQQAVTSRDLIGQAKGVLMERYKLTADAAFALLAHTSQRMNRKLVDVARELVTTGAMPQPADTTRDPRQSRAREV